MINSSVAFDTAIKAAHRKMECRFTDLSGNVLDGDIKSVKAYKGLGQICPGAVFSNYCTGDVYNADDFETGDWIRLEIGCVLADQSVEYIRVGTYCVTECKKTRFGKTFTACGVISLRFNRPFTPAGYWNGLREIIPGLMALTETNIITTMTYTDTTHWFDRGIGTCRNALSSIAANLGAFATEDPDGNIKILKFGKNDTITIQAEDMANEPTFADLYTIDSISVVVREPFTRDDGSPDDGTHFEYPQGAPKPAIIFHDRYVSGYLFYKNCGPNFVGTSFNPGVVTMTLGDPRLEADDVLQIQHVDGMVYKMLPKLLTINFDGGCTVDIDCTIDTTRGNSVHTGSLSSAVYSINSALGAYSELMAKKVTAEQLKAAEAKIKALIADEAIIEQLTANNASIASLIGDEAKIGQLSAGSATILSLIGNTAQLTELITEKSNISTLLANKADVNLLNAKLISGENLITENGLINNAVIKNLKTDNLKVKGVDGLYYTINVTSGAVSAAEAQTDTKYQTGVAGQTLINGSILAEKIAAHSITAKECNMDNLQTHIVRVGNTEGRHIRIDTDSVKVMNGDTILSSFGDAAVIGDTAKLVLSPTSIEGFDAGGIRWIKAGNPYAGSSSKSSIMSAATLPAAHSMSSDPAVFVNLQRKYVRVRGVTLTRGNETTIITATNTIVGESAIATDELNYIVMNLLTAGSPAAVILLSNNAYSLREGDVINVEYTYSNPADIEIALGAYDSVSSTYGTAKIGLYGDVAINGPLAINGNATFTKRITARGGVSGAMIQARAAAQSATPSYITLAAGTITTVPLSNLDVGVSTEGVYEFRSGGVKVLAAGLYRVTGSVYVTDAASSYTDNMIAGCYVLKNDTEVTGRYSLGNFYQQQCVPKVVSCVAGDILYLKARCSVSGKVYTNPGSTYLLIERLA